MRILQATTHFNMGGISRYILTLSKALKDRGVEVTIASSGGDLAPILEEYRIPHYALNIRTKFEFAPKVIISGFRIARLVRDRKISLIHAHTRVSQVACSIASMITGVPYVTTCHGYFRKRARGIIDTWGVKIIAISDAVKRHLRDDLGVHESRIELIYSGIDVEKFSRCYSRPEIESIKREIGLEASPVIGTIGRLSSVKGQRFLIAAMKDIIAKRPDAQCLIVGNGPEEAALKALAGSLGVGGAVKFVESCADTHKYLSVMDVFVFPSVKEGLGIALLEALASGRASVASRIGGIEDIVTDDINGVLVNVGDSSGIANAVMRLLGDASLREKFGAEGARTVRDKFTIDLMADSVGRLYKEVRAR